MTSAEISRAENYVAYMLSKCGYDVLRLAGNFPCDLITATGIRVEVKSSKTTIISGGTKTWNFSIKKSQLNDDIADYVVFVGYDEERTTELFVFVFPVDQLRRIKSGTDDGSSVSYTLYEEIAGQYNGKDFDFSPYREKWEFVI